jgi:hypothetical protein
MRYSHLSVEYKRQPIATLLTFGFDMNSPLELIENRSRPNI